MLASKEWIFLDLFDIPLSVKDTFNEVIRMAHRFGLFPFIATLSLIAIGYFSTLSAFLTPGDSGELIAVSAKLGVLHPPGYPLYTLLAWTFSKLPWGTMAVRISFLSMICQLGAAAFLFCFIKEWRQKTWIASSVTLLFCFSSLVSFRHLVSFTPFILNKGSLRFRFLF